MRYFRVPQTKAAIGMVDRVKEDMCIKTDSKAILTLARWGYMRMYGHSYGEKPNK